MNNIRYSFIPINTDYIPNLLQDWRKNGLKIEYLRKQLQELRAQADLNYKLKIKQKLFVPFIRPVLNYLETTQSKSQSAILLYLSHRYIYKHNYARFKLQDLSDITGININRLSNAIKELQLKRIIKKHPQHPNFTIKNGSKYSWILDPKTDNRKLQKPIIDGVKSDSLLH